MPPISTDLLYTEREFVNDITNEINGIILGVARVNFQRPYPCRIINRSILIPFELFAFLVFKYQEFNVHLNVVTRHLLVVTLGVDLPATRPAR